MTPEEFTELPIDEYAQHVWEHGRYLINRRGQWPIADLYAVGSFYVEVWYDKEQNNITALTYFNDLSKLDAYLGGISLTGLS